MRRYRMGFREKRVLLGLVLTGISGMMGMHTASAAVLAEVTGTHVTIAGNTALGPNGTPAANLYYSGAGQPQATESGDLYVHDNSVKVSGRTVYTVVSGVQVVPSFALSDDGSVRGLVRIENNAVTVENSNTSGGDVYAVHDLTDNSNGKDSSSLVASGNRLTITNSQVGEVGHVTLEGPYINSRNIIQNNVTTVTSSTVNGPLYGTYQHYVCTFGNLERLGNTMSVTDNTVVGSGLYGFFGSFTNGAAKTFTSEKNTLTFSHSVSNGIYSMQDYVYGTTGSFQNNTLRLENGSKAYVVVGESFTNDNRDDTSSSSTMTGNEVILTGGSTAGSVTAVESDYTNEASTASGNRLTVADGSTIRFGAAAVTTGTAENNRISLEDSTAQALIAGEAVGSGAADGNIVSLSGSARVVPAEELTALYAAQSAYGAVTGSSPLVIAGYTESGTASNNEVWASGEADLSRADVYGARKGDGTKPEGSGNTFRAAYARGTAASWKDPVVHGLYHFDTIALYDLDPQKAGLTVTDTLDLPEDAALEISGAALSKLNGSEGLDDASAVAINGTVLKKPIVLIDASKAASVNGLDALYQNSQGTVRSSGTWNFADGGVTVEGTMGLTLSDSHVLSYGLRSLDAITYKEVGWETDGTLLKLEAPEDFSLADTKVDTKDITFTASSLAAIPEAGDYSMTLLDTNGNTTLAAANLTSRKGSWNVGNALTGTGEAYLAENGNVMYKLDVTAKPDTPDTPDQPVKPAVKATDETHNALISKTAAMAALTSGRNRLDGVLQGFRTAEPGVYTFGILEGGRDRYDTGSEAVTRTWNGLFGVTNDRKLSAGDLGYAIFYEYGEGNYDVDGRGSAFDGSGSVHYSGAGAMARYTAENDTYVEGSFRMGRIRNSASDVLHDRMGIAHGYEADTNYWAGHIGFGHIFALSDRTESISRGGTRRAANDVDVYGKYYHTHMGSDAFTADGVRYRLDSMDSDIMRIGARFNHRKKLDDFYAGLAWDYEFDGKGRGSVSTPFGSSLLRAPIEETDIGGSSVMAEIGWKREATKENPWDIDLTLTGYAGEHGGISGRVYVGYHF